MIFISGANLRKRLYEFARLAEADRETALFRSAVHIADFALRARDRSSQPGFLSPTAQSSGMSGGENLQ